MKLLIAVLTLAALSACSDGDGTGGSNHPGSGARSSGGAAWFEEVAQESGLDFVHVKGFEVRHWFPEIIGAGAAWLDYDGDGDIDLYCVQSGDLQPGEREQPGNRLYRNDAGHFTDVTAAAGVGDTGYGQGCATGDYDGDGDVDLYVTNYGPNVLYRNNGDGTFTDVTKEARAGDSGWGLSCGFVDYDTDGDQDLFVVNYVNWAIEREVPCTSPYGTRTYCHPNNYNAPATDTLLRNNGDGTFTDVSVSSGINKTFGNGMGIAIADFDGNGSPDIFVANDGMANQLWVNPGGGGQLVDRGLITGCAVNSQGNAEASMGVAPVDIDQDGDMDLFMTHLREETNTFYLNRNGVFSDKTPQTGLGRASKEFTGFGMGFADFDCDGLLDLYVANGRVGDFRPHIDPVHIHEEPNQLFRGLGDARFEEVEPRGGVIGDWMGTGRGVAFGDYDNDGDVDLVVVDNDARIRLLRNVASAGQHWAMFTVLDATGADALGAVVRIEAGGRTQWRHVQSAYSFCSANDARVHFGLKDVDRIDSLTVRWPDGEEETFGAVPADQFFVLRRGAGQAAAIER